MQKARCRVEAHVWGWGSRRLCPPSPIALPRWACIPASRGVLLRYSVSLFLRLPVEPEDPTRGVGPALCREGLWAPPAPSSPATRVQVVTQAIPILGPRLGPPCHSSLSASPASSLSFRRDRGVTGWPAGKAHSSGTRKNARHPPASEFQMSNQ